MTNVVSERMQQHRNTNNIEYKGKLSDYQVFGKQAYQNISQDFNKYQKLLYERAMYGLGVYSQQEIVDMDRKKRKRIVQVHKRTKRVINLWKQELLIAKSNSIFEKFFPKMPFTSSLKTFKADPMWHCSMELTDFGVRKEHIVVKLLQEGILPQNFYELKTAA